MTNSMTIDSPVGRLTITEADGAVVQIRWGDGGEGDETTPLLAEAMRQLDAYFARRLRCFDLPLRPAGSAFDQRVWAAMQQIAYGQTRRYGELAMEVGSAPRAIGGACGRNPIPIVIPCHRVLASGGLGGYSGGEGLATKRTLLALEGRPASMSAGRKRVGSLVGTASL
ncbi:MAG: methylated-DNA--[protein]-cysteine S-methyltransferase [Stellaceae bacterium]